LGSLVAIPLLLLGKAKRSTRLPFGPFLIAASIIVYLFGSSMIAWYKHLLLV
jgi:prepilin signal peptidase PulO-like enzyme (type II secretory pathway)